MAKHFVTGAAGFLGSHIIEKLYHLVQGKVAEIDWLILKV